MDRMDPKLILDSPNPTNTCPFCSASFSAKVALNKHVRTKICTKLMCTYPEVLKFETDDKTGGEIINAIQDFRLRFLCAQRLGLIVEKLFPLLFVPKRKRQKKSPLDGFADVFAQEESDNLLEKILMDGRNQPIRLLKNISFKTNGTIFATDHPTGME